MQGKDSCKSQLLEEWQNPKCSKEAAFKRGRYVCYRWYSQSSPVKLSNRNFFRPNAYSMILVSQINLHNSLSRDVFQIPFQKSTKQRLVFSDPKNKPVLNYWSKMKNISLYPLYPAEPAHSHCSSLWTGLAQWVEGHLVSSGHFGGRMGWRIFVPQTVTENRFTLVASAPIRMWSTVKA